MISNRQLLGALTAAGIPERACLIFDERYELPEPDWITHDLSRAFTAFLFDSGIRFTDEQFDCNKFAKAASTIADWSWAKTRLDEAALAFGLLAIPGHMLCCAVHTDGDGFRVAFYEPQPTAPEGQAVFSLVTLREVNLDLEDVKRCASCIFV